MGLPADLPFDPVCVDAMLAQQGKVVAYFSLVLLLAPVVETLVLLDRIIFLQERGTWRRTQTVKTDFYLLTTMYFPHVCIFNLKFILFHCFINVHTFYDSRL